MDTYIQQFTNKKIYELLFNKKNIPILEKILEQTAAQFNELLHTVSCKTYFKKPLPKKKLKDLLFEVKTEVDLLLEVIIPNCEICYDDKLLIDGEYNWVTSKVYTLKNNREQLAAPIAHEYAHHAQITSLLLKPEFVVAELSIFGEGYAEGIARYVAKQFAQKEKEQAFLYNQTYKDLNDLYSACQSIYKTIGIKPNKQLMCAARKNLIKPKLTNAATLIEAQKKPHQFGNAFFQIHENKFGPKIYKEIMHGNYDLATKTKKAQLLKRKE